MKLKALTIENFKGISTETTILIDDVVVLIGPNNTCKSTILDAYEAYESIGSARPVEDFHKKDTSLPISIIGIFTEITSDDLETIGSEWLIEEDKNFGRCSKFKIVWEKPDQPGTKYSFSGTKHVWVKGGAGGWDTKLKSRIPTSIRINPDNNHEPLEKVVKELAAKNAEELISKDKGKLARIINEIETLAREVDSEISSQTSSVTKLINDEIKKIFNNVSVSFETGVGKFKAEDAIKDGSRFVINSNGNDTTLNYQGSGVRRAFLWAAISALCNDGLYKKGRQKVGSEEPKVLLIDEPEINLHPSLVRSAQKAIYAIAKLTGWQVICTTHSPCFVDLTADHTTIISTSASSAGVRYFQTDKAKFSEDEKENLKMLLLCSPSTNEFFFYEKSILVEGDTEFLTFKYLAEKQGLASEVCVINCRGKANIPTFIKIFNQFQACAFAVHDLDTPLNKDGSKNAMWTINYRIREAADLTNGRVETCYHNPDIEGYYLNESPKKDKPYNMSTHLTAADFDSSPKYRLLRGSLSALLTKVHPNIYDDVGVFKNFEKSAELEVEEVHSSQEEEVH